VGRWEKGGRGEKGTYGRRDGGKGRGGRERERERERERKRERERSGRLVALQRQLLQHLHLGPRRRRRVRPQRQHAQRALPVLLLPPTTHQIQSNQTHHLNHISASNQIRCLSNQIRCFISHSQRALSVLLLPTTHCLNAPADKAPNAQRVSSTGSLQHRPTATAVTRRIHTTHAHTARRDSKRRQRPQSRALTAHRLKARTAGTVSSATAQRTQLSSCPRPALRRPPRTRLHAASRTRTRTCMRAHHLPSLALRASPSSLSCPLFARFIPHPLIVPAPFPRYIPAAHPLSVSPTWWPGMSRSPSHPPPHPRHSSA
jgi:hypothetical protein